MFLNLVYMFNQGAEDVFCSVDNPKKLYVRQPCNNKTDVCWLTGNKWSGGVEASAPLKADIIVRIVEKNENGNLLIMYQERIKKCLYSDDTYAKKQAPFSYEFYKEKAMEYRTSLSLKSHEEWKKWLLKYKDTYAHNMINDNWLYCSVDKTPAASRPIKLSYLGKSFYLLKEHCFHRIAKLWWDSYTLVDSNGNTLEICGYSNILEYKILGDDKGGETDG